MKTVILLLLMAANLFFLFNIYMINQRTTKISSKAIKDAVQYLNGKNINISEDVIPVEKPAAKIYEGGIYKTEDNLPVDQYAIMRNISKTDLIDGKYFMSDRNSYVSGDYKFVFYNPKSFFINIIHNSYEDEIKYNEDNVYEAVEFLKRQCSDISNKDKKYCEKIISEFFAGFKYSEKYYSIVALQEIDGKTDIVINQVKDGLEIDSFSLLIEIYDGGIINVIGNWYFESYQSDFPMQLFDSISTLLNACQENTPEFQEYELLSVRLIYVPVWHSAENFYLTPMWRFDFQDGGYFIYNSVTGDNFKKNND